MTPACGSTLDGNTVPPMSSVQNVTYLAGRSDRASPRATTIRNRGCRRRHSGRFHQSQETERDGLNIDHVSSPSATCALPSSR